MLKKVYDVGIIGGGIVGASTAFHLQQKFPHLRTVLLEKESQIGEHQSSHNSGVIHCGIYYKPGSLRAQMCVAGMKSMYEYCNKNNIPTDRCGKLIVAVAPAEVESLKVLYNRGQENGVLGLELIDHNKIRQLEPYCTGGLAAIYSPNTGIVDYKLVAQSFANRFQQLGGEVLLRAEVIGLEKKESGTNLKIKNQPGIEVLNVVSCAGLYSDKISEILGGAKYPPIVSFRGEFLRMKPEFRHMVKGLIYPVPNPQFPFLGVHFTKKIDGNIDIGPNAVLAFAREGYRYRDISITDLKEALVFPGMRNLLKKHRKFAMKEFYQSLFRSAQVRTLKGFMPAFEANQLMQSGPSGVRAIAMKEDGSLIEDFVFESISNNVLNVRNAPSPAATSSIIIGREILNKIVKVFNLRTQ